jgi:TPR repeat protein
VTLTIILWIITLLLPISLHAKPYDEALTAYHKKDYAVALQWFTELEKGPTLTEFVEVAERDDPEASIVDLETYWMNNYGPRRRAEAQFYLGVMYDEGFGVAPNHQEAVRWYTQAAEGGEPAAQFNLALMYEHGDGVTQDNQKAVRWYTSAARGGNLKAQLILATMCEQGTGVPQDYTQAMEWYRKAAEAEIPIAMNSLGVVYEHGNGVPQDYVLAHQWYNLAASRAREPDGRDTYTKNRDSLARNMTGQQIAEAQRLATQWKPTP